MKFVDYEADSIVPLVANSPVLSFLYHPPAEYRTNLNRRGNSTRNIIHALGGDEIICTEDEDLRGRLQEITGGRGIEYAIDCVAGEVGGEIIRNLALSGMLVQFGVLSSHRQTDLAKFLMPSSAQSSFIRQLLCEAG